MEISAYIDAVEEHGAALAVAAGKAGLEAEIPSCPGWTVSTLLEHLGVIHRWAAEIVRDRLPVPAHAPDPEPSGDLIDWYLDGHAILLAALRGAPEDLECWTFRPASSPLAFWTRRQAHETAIHRADVEAVNDDYPDFSAEFAADGLSELLVTLVGTHGVRLFADPPRGLLINPSDADVAWHLHIGPNSRTVTVGGAHLPADTTLSGPASNIYVQLWNRQPAKAIEVTGDESTLDLWRERVTIKRR